MKKLLLSVLCAASALAVSAASFTWTYTFKSGDIKSGATATYAGASWTAGTTPYVGWDSNNGKGVQIGSKNNPASSWTLTGTSFASVTKVTGVTVNASTASGGAATLSVKVGDTTLGTETLSTTATDYSFTANGAGAVAISMEQTSSVGLYIKSISVTYEAAEEIKDNSEPATVKSYANIAALIAAANTTDVSKLTGEVTVVHQASKNLYIQDATGAMVVYGDLGVTLTAGQRLTGIEGTYQLRNDYTHQLIDPVASTFANPAAGAAPTPATVTPGQLTPADASKYVKMTGLTVAALSAAKNYSATAGGETITLYNNFNIDMTVGDDITVTGVVSVYNGVAQVYPITIAGGSGEDPVDPNPGALTGDGTLEKPYTVADIISLNTLTATGTPVWVKGYIVGAATGSSASTFSTEGQSASNIFIGDAATDADYKTLCPVQLPTGDVRAAINLQDNPSNLGREVWLYGSLEKYFGQAGLKSVTQYSFDGTVDVPTYTAVATIEDWLDEQPDQDNVKAISGEVAVIYQNGSDLYVQDATGSLLVYGTLGRTYTNGDRLTGIAGYYAPYNNMVEMKPIAATFGAPTAGAAVSPATATLADVTTSNLAKYVTISGLKLTLTPAATEEDKDVYTVSDGTNTVVVYDRYHVGLYPGEGCTVTGFVYVADTTMELVPIQPVGDSSISEIATDAAAPAAIYDLQGRRVIAPTRGLYIVNGRKVIL